MGKSQLDLSTLEDESYALTNLINAEMNNGVRLTNPEPVDTNDTKNSTTKDNDTTVKVSNDINIELVNDNESQCNSSSGDDDNNINQEYQDYQDSQKSDDDYNNDNYSFEENHIDYEQEKNNENDDNSEIIDDYHDNHDVPINILHAQQKTQKRTLVVKIKELQQRLYDIETCPKTFTVSDSLEELEYEYERLVELRNARSTRAWYRKLLLGLTNGIEWINHKWNPVGLKLDGWSTDLAATIDEFDDIFDELAEKYGGNIQSRISPELRLVALVLYSGMAYSVGQTLASKATPEIAEIINKDPVLRERFVKAATDIQMEKMSTTNTTTAPFFGKVKNTINDIFSTTKQNSTTINEFMNDLDNSDIKVNELGL